MFFFDRSETQAEYREALGSRISDSVDKAKKNDASKTKTAVADAAGVTAEQLNKWIKGTVKVPVDALRSLASFTDTDFSWLVTGENSASQPPASTLPHAPPSPTDLDQPGMIAIPRYDEVRPSAGHGSVAISEIPTTRVAFEQRWLTDIGVSPKDAVILPAQGDSMSPTIPNGAPMLVDTSKREVRNGFIYVFNIDGDLVVKRIERLPDGTFDLISDNRNYPTRNLSRDTVTNMMVIGRVYAAVSKF